MYEHVALHVGLQGELPPAHLALELLHALEGLQHGVSAGRGGAGRALLRQLRLHTAGRGARGEPEQSLLRHRDGSCASVTAGWSQLRWEIFPSQPSCTFPKCFPPPSPCLFCEQRWCCREPGAVPSRCLGAQLCRAAGSPHPSSPHTAPLGHAGKAFAALGKPGTKCRWGDAESSSAKGQKGATGRARPCCSPRCGAAPRRALPEPPACGRWAAGSWAQGDPAARPGSALWLTRQSLPLERAPAKEQSPQSDPLWAQHTGQHPAQPPCSRFESPIPWGWEPPGHPAYTTAISLLFKEL